MASDSRNPLKIVVLSCGELGPVVADRLSDLPQVAAVTLILCPWRTRKRTAVKRAKQVLRREGNLGFARALIAKAWRGTTGAPKEIPTPRKPTVEVLRFSAFEDRDCIDAMSERQLDLGVLAGTYILPAEVFDIPRLGSINLHSGKVPEYRGSAPAFWELYNGETEVGITVHQVAKKLDAGAVYRSEQFPLDPAPLGDPMDYIARLRSEVLKPNGVRLLAEAVEIIADGGLTPVPQDSSVAKTYRQPNYEAVKELRRRVARRRMERRQCDEA